MVVYVWVAQVNADAVVAVVLAGLVELFGDQVKRLRPLHFLPAGPGFAYRLFQAVRIFVQILKRNRLRTDMPPAERIILIALYGSNPAVLHFDRDTAHGLAKVTGTIVGAVFHEGALLKGCCLAIEVSICNQISSKWLGGGNNHRLYPVQKGPTRRLALCSGFTAFYCSAGISLTGLDMKLR